MDVFAQQLIAGVADGAIYACIALALVTVFRATGHVNFAQGEMAMFSTFIAWQMMRWGLSYWTAFAGAIAISFAAGVVIDRLLFKPIRAEAPLSHIVMFVGLLAVLNSGAASIWDFTSRPFPAPFGTDPLLGSDLLSTNQATIIATTLLLLALLHVFFRYTSIGLAMQAASENPESARLVGIRVEWMISLGWGMAAAIGAIAGILVAPIVFLEPNMMIGILVYGFAGAVLGGLSSPCGAVCGGFAVGIVENLAGTYVPKFGGELKFTIALFIIVVVLVVKPTGLFGTKQSLRV
jgi:branched-chain amino acid transport system permease protein